MYAFISGKLEYIAEGIVIVNNNGIGYNIFVSNNTLTNLPKIGCEVKLLTYTSVKEDSFSLFGFLLADEKRMFDKLINISGVGCKMALQILSGIDSAGLAIAIANNDVSGLSKIKGVGKKTAERIILELKEKVDLAQLAPQTGGSVNTAFINDKLVADAVEALVSLQINKGDAYKAVVSAREKTDKLEQIISIALRSIDR